MKTNKLRQVAIDTVLFDGAYNRDTAREICPEEWHLDCDSGEVLVSYPEDEDAELHWGIPAEDNAILRQEIMDHPDRFLQLSSENIGGIVNRENMQEAEYSRYTVEVNSLLASNGIEAVWK